MVDENQDIDMDDLNDLPDLEKLVKGELDEKEEEKKKEEPKIPKNFLEIYYNYYYPYDFIYKWLGKNSRDYFERREFSFTSDRYLRFQCFKSAEELKKMVCKLIPKKIDFGAVYNTFPNMHNQISTDPNAFVPIEKELVFDIDLTDYDEVRTCCKEAKVCNKCWKFMIISYLILKDILEIDFGFEKISWVFSGRRGIHCWISDDRARKLTNDGRCAIANFIKYKISNIKMNISGGLREPIHPSLLRAIEIIEKYFDEYILDGQEILKSENGKTLLIGLIKSYYNFKSREEIEKFINDKIVTILNRNIPSRAMFDQIKDELKRYENTITKKSNSKYTKAELIIKDYMLNILYPRLDINVSKHINHLLKSPFVIHPSTGLVSVPLNDFYIKNFKVESIPNIFDIVKDHQEG